VDPIYFSQNPESLALGMLAALIASAVFLNLATCVGMPVSTTHAIVGAVAGFGIVEVGMQAIYWEKLASIAFSWLISPLMGGIVAFLVFKFVAQRILRSRTPYKKAVAISPYLVFVVVSILVLSIIYKGLRNLHLDVSFGKALLLSGLTGAFALMLTRVLFRNRKEVQGGEDELVHVEKIFAILQIITASYVAFAHGANDVANAIGPLAAIFHIAKTGTVAMTVHVPIGVLLLGGVGIVVGLATFGYRVIETIGRKITEITPSRGFSAEFATATTVLICSKLGIPISTTHTLVGSVLGVGLARGIAVLNFGVVRNIIGSWLITIPITAFFTIVIFKILTLIY
jgi:PiT family inorganic phosphate transporter